MTGRIAALVYNPRAGRLLRARPKFEEAVGILRRTWPGIRMIETTGPRTAGPLAKAAACEGAEVVVACGGDGTINEVTQSLAGTGIPVGILPGGTANVLANEIGVGNDLSRAASLLSDAEPFSVATGLLVDGSGKQTTFNLMAGIGFDARLVHALDVGFKERWGKVAYWAIALRHLAERLQPFDVTAAGETFRSTFTIVSRVRNYGGDVAIARGASLLSDEFEAVVFEDASVVRLAWLLVTGVATRTLHRKRDVHVRNASRIELRPAGVPAPVQVDGEAAGFLPATLEIGTARMILLAPSVWIEHERARVATRPSSTREDQRR